MRGRLFSALVVLGCVSAVVFVAACGGDSGGAGSSDTEAAGTAAGGSGSGFSPEVRSLKFGNCCVDPILAEGKIAEQLGIFKKYGLDVEFVSFESDTQAVQALESGAVDVIAAGGGTAISSGRQGDPNVMVAVGVSRPSDILVASGDIRKPEDLVGKRIAVSQLGGESHATVILALQKLGIDPADVTITQVGGQSDRLAALQAGSVDAAPLDETLQEDLEKDGFNVLIKLSDTGLRTPRAGLVIPKKFLTENPNATLAVTGAFAEAMQVMVADPKRAAQVVGDWAQLDPTAARAAVDAAKSAVIDQRCLRSKPAWWQTQKKIMTEFDPGLEQVDTDQVWTNDVLDQLSQKGFFKKIGAPC